MVTCSACGAELPPQFRFCGYCGAALAAAETPAAPGRESRRSVTVVFSDLKGSTSLGERLDHEALREVMTRYFDEMSAALERHGGTIEKFIGDAIMAVFGMPVAHEDDALRAVRAAHEMTQRLAVLNDELERGWGVSLHNRTGVNTGPVVASGDASSRQRLVTGDTVNVAARLEQAAPADEVLIGEATYRLVRDAVEVEEVEPLELKGKSQRVPAYRLISVAELGAAVRRHDVPLVGRQRELDALGEALAARVERGDCQLVTLLADAGAGKSRLIEELMTLASERGGAVARGRCLPYGRGITFWPLVEMVAQLAGIAQEDAPDAARAKIAALVDDEAVLERVAVAVGLSQAEFPLDELYWGTRKLFEGLARRRPLLVVFEDIHWAESALLDLLEQLAATTEAPLLVVCAARPDLRERHPEWPALEGTLALELGPLTSEDVERLVEHLLGGALPAEVRAKIVDAAEGNPLFVEQLVAMFVEEGMLTRDGEHWRASGEFSTQARIPASIEGLLSARLDLLPPDELALVESASVIGLIFPRDPLEQLVPESARPIEPQLAQVAAKQLVQRTETESDEVYRFHHILIRDASYNRLPKRTRSGLHVRFADWAERVNRDRDRELEFQEIVGYHLEQARRYLLELAPLDAEGVELGRRAASHLVPAGRRAFARGDMWAAANLLQRGVDLLPAGARERLELLPDLGEALMEIGEFADAQRLLDDAVASAALLDDDILEADALLTRLLVAHHTVSDLDAWRTEVQREADRLIPTLERAAAAGALAKAWRMVAFVHGTVCQWEETTAALERAIQNARVAADARQLARLSASYVMALSEGPTPAPAAIAATEEVLRYGLVDRQAEAVALLALAPLYGMSGELGRARELAGRGAKLLRDLGATVLATRTSTSSAQIEFMAGDPRAAEEKLRADYDALTAMDERYFRPIIAALLAKALFALDRHEEAEELARLAAEIADDDDVEAQAQVRSVRARLLAAQGRPDEARALAREVIELLSQTDAPVLRADALVDVSEVFADAPEERVAVLREARSLYEIKQHRLGMSLVEARLEGSPSVEPDRRRPAPARARPQPT